MPNQQYHHKATEISHYNDCVTKHAYGRSVKSEFGAYGQARLETQALVRISRLVIRTVTEPSLIGDEKNTSSFSILLLLLCS